MNLSRLEAFSDGVFAFAATLLVIGFKVPDLHGATAAFATHALTQLGPPLLAYVTSFLVIGVIWINHHPIFKGLTDVDRGGVLLNLLLLIVVAFLPFPTELIAEYGTIPPIVAFYGLSQAVTGLAFCALWFYIERRYRLASGAVRSRQAIMISRAWAIAYPILALCGAFVAYGNTTLSVIIYVSLPAIYLLPTLLSGSSRERRVRKGFPLAQMPKFVFGYPWRIRAFQRRESTTCAAIGYAHQVCPAQRACDTT